MPSPLLPSFIAALKSAKSAAGLNEAIALAALAHAGQTDKGGAPYIAHPLRVMLDQKDEVAMTVAVLHDILEDIQEISADDLLNMGFSEDIVAALNIVTRQNCESYEAFIHRIGQSQNKAAITVKVADLRDNANLDRIKNPKAKDRERAAKYRNAILILGTSPYWDCAAVGHQKGHASRMILETYKDRREHPNAVLTELRMALRFANSQHEGMREEFARQLRCLCIPCVFSKDELGMMAKLIEGQQPIGHRPPIAPTEKKSEARRALHLKQLLYAMAGHVTYDEKKLARRAKGCKEISIVEAACGLLHCSPAKFNGLLSYAKGDVTPLDEEDLIRVSEHFAQKGGHKLGRGADAVFEYCITEKLIG